MRIFVGFVCVLLALPGVIRADPVPSHYVGPSGTFDEVPTNYTVPENWDPAEVPNNVPGTVYLVDIPKDVFVDIAVTINSLTTDLGGSLTVKDSSTAAGSFVTATNLSNLGSLTIHNSAFNSVGLFTNFDSGTGTLSGGTFVVEGFDLSDAQPRTAVFQFASADIHTNESSLTVTNHAMIVDQLSRDGLRNFASNLDPGSFVVGSGFNFVAPGTFTNTGTVAVQGAIPDVNGFAIDAGSFTVPTGRQYFQTSGTTTINGNLTADLTDIQGGTLSVGGVITGNLTLEGATLSPTGQTTAQVTGDVTLDSASTLQFSIPTAATIVDDQFTSQEYDHLTIGGDVVLGNSTLAVEVAPGFPVSSHTTFTILDCTGTIGGKFANVTTGSRLTTVDGLGSFLVSLTDQVLELSDFQAVPPASQFANLSTRGEVLTGDNILIGGFIVVGTETKDVLLRALGPSLSEHGVQNALPDPVLELHDSAGALIAFNNNWKDTQQGAIEETGVPPTNDLESALVMPLAPGAYTVVVRGNNNTTGTALVEAYDLSPNADTTLSNLSTRGFVDAANPLIGGFIAGGNGIGDATVVLRALGPELAGRGITNPLADPVLELRDVNGALVLSDDDYIPGSDSVVAVKQLEPTDPLEAVIRANLAPGNYTALVLAKGSDSGLALVELFDLSH
jgi:hypothetical protein